MRNKTIVGLVIILAFISLSLYSNRAPADKPYFFELTLKTYAGGRWVDYNILLAQYLEDIGIKVHLKTMEWNVFIGALVSTSDFDLACVGIGGGGASPDQRSIFTEHGSLNIFGLDSSIPYQALSETMQNDGVTIVDPVLRQAHYNDWQTLVMDKIIPLIPLYTPVDFEAVWANLEGYDYEWELSNSLPYMQFHGLHPGQTSIDEFNEHDLMWHELNPLLSDDIASSHINSLIMEPVLQISPGFNPLKTGLINNWEYIDDYHYKFFLRDNVYWNPSYDVTTRTAISPPLSSIPSDQLMIGLKNSEYSDGVNQQVTAKDAVFTYLVWNNPLVSEDTTYHDWISDCYVDPFDPLAFHIHIDANPGTPEKDLYADFWHRMNFEMLPEFFLNSSAWETYVSYTSGGVKCWGIHSDMLLTPQWIDYSNSAFGCGKYMLDYYISHSKTVLQKSPYWMGYGIKDGAPHDLDIQTINVRVIPDESAALAEFKAGTLDKMPLDDFDDEVQPMSENPHYVVQSKLYPYFDFIAFNLQREPIGGTNNFIWLTEPGKEEYTVGVAIRKAISYAIDKVEINERINVLSRVISDSPICPYTSYYYYDDIIKYRRDLTSAWEWMEAAGYNQVDLLTGYTFTSYDEPPETTTVTNTETITVTETNTTSFSGLNINQQKADTTNNPMSLIAITIAFVVVIALPKIVKRRRKS